MIPLSLYIHIPWCEKKCPYCDFNSHQSKAENDEAGYINALLNDLSLDLSSYKEAINDRQIESIFIGGGTPSLFSSASITRLLDGVKNQITLSDDCEITMEANPGSSETEKFAGFLNAGVNRLSIGVQSFNEGHLKSLGRVHNSEQALNAAQHARDAGFDNFNLDLMFGLPKQSPEQSLEDIQTALSLNPTHLSCYQLTIEPNTLFHHRPPPRPDDDVLWQMQLALQQQLAQADYKHYEVSAYARPNKQSRHNLNYWQFGDYLGIGAGAHGKITDTDLGVKRYWKIKHPDSYLRTPKEKRSFVGGVADVDAAQLSFEFMMNALRLTEGFPTELFSQRTGQSLSNVSDILERHKKLKLIALSEDWLRPTKKGQQFLDSLLQDYLPDSTS